MDNKLKTCSGCGKEFQAQHGRQAFCSPPCKSRYYARMRRAQLKAQGFTEHTYKATKRPKVCLICGEKFTPIHFLQKYCSPKCGRKADDIRLEEKLKTKVSPVMKQQSEFITLKNGLEYLRCAVTYEIMSTDNRI